MNLYLEFDCIIRRFDEMSIRYALCGGFAVGIYGPLRATEDIDFIIHPDDLEKAAVLLHDVGYRLKSPAWRFSNTSYELNRFMKPIPDMEDMQIVDLLVPVSDETQAILDRAEKRSYADTYIRVVKKADLITMKMARGSLQDKADIKKLEDDS
ncbi:MAG: hypothetical protein EOM20_19545 [Spartobacteria bacterium]|nr:hypothetical protein [Spartobacteria bacterium]